MPEEQRRILEMLASKQITVEQADRLLAAVSSVSMRGSVPGEPRNHALRHQHNHVQTAQSRGGAGMDGGAYLRELRAAGLRDLKPHELIALKTTGVDGAYIKELRAHGLGHCEAHDLIALKSVGVDGTYIQDLRDAGLEPLDVHDLIACKSQDIDGAYVRRLRAAGFTDLAPHDLIGLKSQGIDATDEEYAEGYEEEYEAKDDEPPDETTGASPSGGETVRLLSAGDEPDGK